MEHNVSAANVHRTQHDNSAIQNKILSTGKRTTDGAHLISKAETGL